jgi:urease accessory protein
LLTTPAATKLYRCNQEESSLAQEVSARADAFCEWLPQETIAFDGARSQISTRFFLEGEAQLIGWEILCLGRPAIAEAFEKGQLVQNLELYREGKPLLLDRLSLGRGPCARLGKWGLGGQAVVGTMIFSGKTATLVSELRAKIEALEQRTHFACTELEGCVVLRYLGPQVSDCWKAFNQAWEIARPLMGRAPPHPPRIWKC